MRNPTLYGAGSGVHINRSDGGGSPRRPPHSTQGAGNCKEKPQMGPRFASRLPDWEP
jgi:hypothetical protein